MECAWKKPLREQYPTAVTVGSKGVVAAPRSVKGNMKDLRARAEPLNVVSRNLAENLGKVNSEYVPIEVVH